MTPGNKTDAVRLLLEVRVFQERFQKLFSHMPAVVFSRSGRVTHLNSAAEAALAIKHDQIVGRTLYSVGRRVMDEHGHHLPLKKQPWMQAIAANELISDIVTGITLPGGASRWHQTTSMPLATGHGMKPKSVIVILTDVTKHQLAQAQLMQFRKMDALGALTGGLAHDFNNILTSICSATQLILLDRNESDADYEALKDIENEALRGAELTKQLLLFSKPSHSRTKTTRLNDRLAQLRRLLRRTIPRNIKIELDMAHEQMSVRIDPTQFEQVILNLAINARDAMPSGGTLTIRAALVSLKADACPIPDARPGTYARIDVTDTGVGIIPDLLPRVFEPFYSSKDHESGTGLGLSIVYSIIRQHRGHITVDSARGVGTKITLFLPARRAAKPRAARSAASPHPRGGHETIMVVDDERIITKSTARFLERYGYHTLIAYNGSMALELFRKHEHEVDLILLDLEMPEMNGPQCLAQILSLRPRSKVIVLSGHIMKETDWDPIKAGAQAFIRKPFDSNYLVDTVRSVLDRT